MAWLTVVFGFLIGSFPTAYIAGRLTRGKDIRQLGDGNVGAQNAFRQLGAKVGVAVFFIDVGKGALAIAIAQVANVTQIWVLLTGAAVVIGHNWPVFLGFRGGRGEATTIGVLLTLIPYPILITTAPALITLIIKKNVIIASCVLFIPLPLMCWWFSVPGVLVAYSIALMCLVGITHFFRVRQSTRTSNTSSAG
jgi:glycerol-3-phosphate acyltransferase PlsY